VNYRFCHRCQTELPPHDEGTLIFCSHCGAPQVLLSEDLQEQVAAQASAALEGAEASAAAIDPRTQVWVGAIHCVALAGGVAAMLAGLSMLLPGVILLTLLWAVVSPVVVIGLFQKRFPLAPITSSFGARLGLLTGLSVALALSVINTVALLIARYSIHAMSDVDKQVTMNLDQFKAQVLAQPGAPLLSWVNALSIPEFRAGFLLMGMAVTVFLFLIITTTGGAFAGYVRSRPRT
jgi:hypothetical protein